MLIFRDFDGAPRRKQHPRHRNRNKWKAISLCFASLFLFGCTKPRQEPKPEFIYIGNSKNPYAMFDVQTGQACYAGPYLDADERKSANFELIAKLDALNPDGLFICERLDGMPKQNPFAKFGGTSR